jgi:hypothetical protein
MTWANPYEPTLQRIATALERIATALDQATELGSPLPPRSEA